MADDKRDRSITEWLAALGSREVRGYQPHNGPDEPDVPPPGRASASLPDGTAPESVPEAPAPPDRAAPTRPSSSPDGSG